MGHPVTARRLGFIVRELERPGVNDLTFYVAKHMNLGSATESRLEIGE
jgi:hypothetical protein